MTVLYHKPGTYILLIALEKRKTIRTVRSREWVLEPGLYGYVGSALGPGGLRARLKRHLSGAANKHWHIDYLLAHTRPVSILVKADGLRHECHWAKWVERISPSCVAGFGASDCRCKGHLFQLGARKEKRRFEKQAMSELRAHILNKEECDRLRE